MPTGHAAFDLVRVDFETFVMGGRFTPAWSPDGKSLAFVEGPADERAGWLVDLATGDKKPLFPDVPALRAAILAATGETPPGRGLPFAYVGFAGPRLLATMVGACQLLVDLDSGAVTKQPGDSVVDTYLGVSETYRRTPQEFLRTQPLVDPVKAQELLSPDGRHFVSTVDGDVHVRSTQDGRTVPLTTDGSPEHEYRFDLVDPMVAVIGMAFPVCNFSPDGSRLVAYKVENRGVHQAPQVHFLKREEELVWRVHGQAGGTLERTTLHVLDLYGRAPVEIDLGDTTDTYPVPVAWLPDGSRLVVFVMSRDCRRVEVVLADATKGAVTPVFSEHGDTFVRIHHDIYFGKKTGLFLTPSGDGLVWLSQRSGWKHLYLYALDGTLVRQLTDGEWPVDYVHRIADGYVYFTAHLDQARPYDVQLARVPLAGGPVERLSEGEGVHGAMFSPSGEVLVDTWSTPSEAPRSVLRRVDGKLLTGLSTVDTSRLAWTPSQQFTVTAADGQTELWGVMFFPADFDESKKYPLVEYVYGGPQIAVAPHEFFSWYARDARALAQLGYVTFVLDGRGTPGRSKAFHDVVFHDWTAGLVPDHAAAVEQLKARRAFLSDAKVGVIGRSWGGYSAFRLAAERPDVYTAAVSSAPGFDPYSSVLYECYLGFPQTERSAYEKASCYPLAARMEAAFLLACGSSDHATWPDAMKMSEALIRAGRPHEFVVLPEQYHAYDTVHDGYFWQKVIGFFTTHLGAGPM
ncbi:DPP IV N-terminal domain-containing protein [Sphaerisporangium sp. NPDC051011]|uniref:S9 family peptidase n=1 Tax=Sphaerisporangium sp. NPDC051011 TaxID=3155792 RepID=UPI0033E626AB